MAIINICVIENSEGKLYGVGSDCVAKTFAPCLADKAKVEVARIQSRKAAARRDAKRVEARSKWLTKVCNDKGETNQQRLEREESENLAKQRAESVKRSKIAELLSPLADRLADGSGRFCDSIAEGLRNGRLPYGKGRTIMVEILAKQFGKAGSESFLAEEARIISLINSVDKASE